MIVVEKIPFAMNQLSVQNAIKKVTDMQDIKSFTEKEIRAVRDAEAIYEIYWVHAELLVDGQWITPYLVQEEKLKWHGTDEKMRPTERIMKEYLQRQLKYINELLEKGYKLVSYDKYKEVIHKYHNPLDYEPTTVYL